jgi:hypothetical protein
MAGICLIYLSELLPLKCIFKLAYSNSPIASSLVMAARLLLAGSVMGSIMVNDRNDQFLQLAKLFESLRNELLESRKTRPDDFAARLRLLRRMRVVLTRLHLELGRPHRSEANAPASGLRQVA